jgi:hypothetical protein
MDHESAGRRQKQLARIERANPGMT